MTPAVLQTTAVPTHRVLDDIPLYGTNSGKIQGSKQPTPNSPLKHAQEPVFDVYDFTLRR